MKTDTIIAGIDGVGKSSFTGVLKAERNDLGYIIDVDKIAAERKCGALEAGKIAITKIDDFLYRDISFTQETTLSGRRTEKTVKIAKEKRIYHDIAEADVERRFRKRFDSLDRILPYCDEVHLYDNENGFVEVGEYRNGELIPKSDYRPQWLRELIEFLLV